MNLIEHVVVEILSEPVRKQDDFGEYYLVSVNANSHGSIKEHTLITTTIEEAKEIKVGYRFEA